MADFVAVLRKTLDGLNDATPQTREKVYDKARSTIAAKLAAMNPPPPEGVIDRQKRALEDAIASIEREYATEPASNDPLAELENVFASLKNPEPRPIRQEPPPAPKAAPPSPQPVPAPVPMPAPVPPPEPVSEPEPPHTENAPPLAGSPQLGPETESDDAIHEEEGDREPELIAPDHPYERRRSYGGLVAAGIALAVLAGGGYGVWLNKDAFSDILGLERSGPMAGAPVETRPLVEPEAEAETEVAAAPPAETSPAATPPAAAPAEDKFTQRLTSDGGEVDPGPAGGEAAIGEGTSVAAATQPPSAPATPEPAAPTEQNDATDAAAPPAGQPPAGQPAAAEGETPAEPDAPVSQPSVAVGRRAIFYEERTNVAEGSAEPGSIVWSLVQESPGGDLPPEPAIRAEATIPGKDVQLRMTIRRNADQTLPASHIIEVIFLTPEGFEGGGIDNVLRVSMKGSEQEAGSPLIGIPAKIADGFFLVALNDSKPEIDANLTLLRRQSWIDVPVIYKSGRRALFTMEKGIPGAKVFDEAMKAWQAASSSAG
ncbi:hypothetical protein [Allomesorhizobium alhagi]|uniref:CheA signal transduction histidine kinase n=1 Tax=Mesorhizobium alhagi CCNWXJ12-2 TaxID=1107882 RepID=H0HLC7_9HYPH|nr:hypothetical protein [Mesorhizobium alhagi]EHK58456.1 hypothetical protein MAXJ12_04689 [Mesorhizobium alhagi CCNWXJ12-2]